MEAKQNEHERSETFGLAMMWFVVPATSLGIVLSLFYRRSGTVGINK